MANISRGIRNRPRKNARNYTQREAQKRLDETVKPFNRQVENSLFVNAVEVDYYQTQAKIGRPCTCQKTEIHPEHYNVRDDMSISTTEPVVPTAEEDSSAGLGIRLQDNNLFGDSEAEKLFGETQFDVSGGDYIEDEDIPEVLQGNVERKEGDVELTETSMYGNNARCGICYKTGFQPGFNAYGKKRFVLTTWDIAGINGYTIMSAKAPNSMRRQGPVQQYTFVEFEINVPKYFKSCLYSIRDNTQVLQGERMYVEGKQLSMALLRKYAGQSMLIRVTAKEFTHLVLEFDLGLEKVKANLGPESQALDYTKYEAISNFPLVMPPSIHEVNVGDIVVIKDRRLVLKIIDRERKITSDKRQLEWMVQTRIVQKTEPLRNIAKGMKIL